ncbi:hypothetical protein CANARDRAFT_202449 [[Candida] arabinofermentans NRRL YB-2248]|uniref:Xylanolytic transcriptional activator regulatory domain-containing protein n=1 Tax=[Candida] arabinofermentans NRRL YB-2248 TaxID=983967 RepID=A0A1E4SW65_9ASCO|nr:hypothetical protein CANARDRAFT_202449 [[Candida] arabinofermentans NRRL YB-2248]
MPTVTSSPNIASTITEIAILKKRLEELENNIEARSPGKATDTISLIYDKNGDCSLLLMSKKNRFLCLGSFCYITMWKRDFLVSHLLEDFRRLKMEVRARIKEVNGVVDKTDSEHLARKMAAFFPPEQITNLHLNRFFDYIYPFIPVLDEKGFRDSVSSILSFSNVDGRLELKIDKKLDLVIVATLLVMMRLSYTTLYLANDAQPVSQDSDAFQILEYPINLTVIEYVHFALQNVNYLRKSSIEVLQLLLLIRRYQSISQEDNDGMAATDGYIYNGLICETALSMGLNRNLSENVCDSSIPQVTDVQNPKFNSVCQKLWWSVIEMDITHAMRFGKKPAIHQDDSATELPLFDPSASNSYNLASEKFFPIFNFKSVHNLPNMIEKLSVFQLTELDAKFQQFLNLEIFKEMTDTPALWGVNRSTTSLYYESNLDLPFPETPDVTQIQSLSDYSVRPPTATDGHELIDGSSVDPMSFEDLKDWLSTSEFFDIFEQLGNISPASV